VENFGDKWCTGLCAVPAQLVLKCMLRFSPHSLELNVVDVMLMFARFQGWCFLGVMDLLVAGSASGVCGNKMHQMK